MIPKRDCFCSHTWFARKALRPVSLVHCFRPASETNNTVAQAQYPRHRNMLACAWHRPWNDRELSCHKYIVSPQIQERQLQFQRWHLG